MSSIRTDHASTSTTCDRRRSRAARSLLMNKTLPILQHYSNYPVPSSSSSSDSIHDNLQTYKILMTDLISNPEKCILNPSNDLYWKEELHHSVVKARFMKRTRLHKCDECGKTFRSRYYLDLHMQKHSFNSKHGKICPADQWCHLLGSSLCDRYALEKEPYYAPNIYDEASQRTLYATSVQKKFQREINLHPCNMDELEDSKQFCREALEECFAGIDNVLEEMTQVLCETQSCRFHLDMLHKRIESVHIFKQEWERHQNDLGRWGYSFSIFVLGVFAYWMYNHSYKTMKWIRSTTSKAFKGETHKRSGWTSVKKFDQSKRKAL